MIIYVTHQRDKKVAYRTRYPHVQRVCGSIRASEGLIGDYVCVSCQALNEKAHRISDVSHESVLKDPQKITSARRTERRRK